MNAGVTILDVEPTVFSVQEQDALRHVVRVTVENQSDTTRPGTTVHVSAEGVDETLSAGALLPGRTEVELSIPDIRSAGAVQFDAGFIARVYTAPDADGAPFEKLLGELVQQSFAHAVTLGCGMNSHQRVVSVWARWRGVGFGKMAGVLAPCFVNPAAQPVADVPTDNKTDHELEHKKPLMMTYDTGGEIRAHGADCQPRGTAVLVAHGQKDHGIRLTQGLLKIASDRSPAQGGEEREGRRETVVVDFHCGV